MSISKVTVVLGTMTFGVAGSWNGMVRITTHEGVVELLDVFKKHGHCEIDTARMYGSGSTEEYLGAIGWQKRGLKLGTKHYPTKGKSMSFLYPKELSHSPADLREGLNDSLAALKTDKFSIFYLHAPDRTVPFEDTLREINKMYEEGIFERFGLSNFFAWEVAQVCEICKAHGWVMPTAYQGVYNTLQRHVETELISCLRFYGISFYVYNPLAGGFLTSRYTRGQTVFEDAQRFNPANMAGQMLKARLWNDANFTALEILRPALAPHGIPESEAALRWLAHHSVLKKEFGDAVIVGAGSAHHLEDNLVALEKGPLPDDVVKALDEGWGHTRALPSMYSQ
ncbi:NADP-dependent oxidoreductase domain-containing protein [Mycena belliarum]|uniref:NADP-dependent oxidoreductase domain-containing protein n=1 Tax=Mycena belliarum TaxID=1033014 RepID=A0AAD6UES1_9AGAR|nr:NADP-dependent oxidoreductase domain-containing protein [Mycena belliae]